MLFHPVHQLVGLAFPQQAFQFRGQRLGLRCILAMHCRRERTNPVAAITDIQHHGGDDGYLMMAN